MKKRILSMALCLCMVLTLLPMAVLAGDDWTPSFTYPDSEPSELWAGGGTKNNPYQIKTAQDLANLAYMVNNGTTYVTTDMDWNEISECFKLMNDIDLNPGFTFKSDGTYTGPADKTPAAWTPIGYRNTGIGGTFSYPFSGNFDGGGHTISGLYINETADTTHSVGLFGYVEKPYDGAANKVSNVKLDNLYIKSGNQLVGAVTAYASGTTVTDCGVSSTCYVSCVAIGTTTADKGVGGIVGYATGATIQNCLLSGSVSSTNAQCPTGGIVGKFNGKAMDNCWFLQTDTVNANLNLVGESKNGATEPTNSGVLSAPSSPTAVGAVAGDAQVTLNWTAPTSTNGSAAITGYKVAYSTTDIAPTEVSNWTATNSTSTEYTVSGLKNGTTYYFWVKAMSEAGESVASASATAMPMGAIMDVTTADQMTAVLSNAAVTTINVTGSFSYDGAISKAVAINVKSGSTLTLNYSTANSISTVCNANITVESGGEIKFHQIQNPTPYLIFNGNLTINNGGTATTSRGVTGAIDGGILFLGNFTNNGSFDTTNANTYLKYGTTPGTFTSGSPNYNLCITTRSKTSASDPKLYITSVVGTVAVGETLHPVLDGFGEIRKAIPGLPISWGDSSNGGNTFAYTVPASKAGTAITVKVNGSPSGTVAYFIVDGTTVTKITTPDSTGYTTAPVTKKEIIVTFDANGGTCGTATLTVDASGKLASLPTPTRSGSYTFDGWYTLETGGIQITTETVFTDSKTVYAHWTYTGGSSGSGGGGATAPSVTVPVSSDEGKVSVSASVSGGTATIAVTDQQLAEIASNTASTGTVTVDLSGFKNVDSAKIPAKVITAANTATGSDGLEIILPTGRVKLDETALASVASTNKEITVSVAEVKTSSLTAAQKEALGDKIDSAVVVDVNVLLNGTKTSDFNGGTLTVSFPYTPKPGQDPSQLTVWFIKDDGTIEKMGGHYDAKSRCFVFETTHLSQYVLVSDPRVNPFTDVAESAYFYDAVLWAVEKGITSGTSATTFNPNTACTRAQSVTFLWRAAGSPEPTSGVNPFTDVKSDAYYYKAVLWAIEKGITSGTSATKFSPNAVCSRSQAVTFLWRAAGSPVVNYAMDFTDVPADSYCAEAVRWAVSEGITGGTRAATFSPAAECTRAQIVTFLYRCLG